jgi:hypothetical protein
VTLDLNGPAGRSQAAGRTGAEQLLREDALGDEVELRSTVTESGLLIELAGRLLCDVGVERGRITSMVAYQAERR